MVPEESEGKTTNVFARCREGMRRLECLHCPIGIGDRPAPSPEILRKLAKAYNVTVRELLTRAGYLDDPEVTATEEERIEAAFQYVLSDPDYKLGTRIRGEDSRQSQKRHCDHYETLTGKNTVWLNRFN